MAIINPTGTGAWKKSLSSIQANSSAVVHAFPEDGFRCLRYVFNVYSSSQDRSKSFEFLINKDGGNLKTSMHNKLGSIFIGVQAVLSLGVLEVTITNNENFDLLTEFAFVSLGNN